MRDSALVSLVWAAKQKADFVITYKLLNNQQLTTEQLSKLQSVEFTRAINRLQKLVEKTYIKDDIAIVFVKNKELLVEINFMRNATLHRGRRVMQYCSLDKVFSENILPLIKQILDIPYYNKYKRYLSNIHVFEVIEEIINEGKNSTIDYSAIAYFKEIGRCKWGLLYKSKLKEDKDKEYIDKHIDKKMASTCEDTRRTMMSCPCCGHKTIFSGRTCIGNTYDELGDETNTDGGFQIIEIPEYENYIECAWCGLKFSSFISE